MSDINYVQVGDPVSVCIYGTVMGTSIVEDGKILVNLNPSDVNSGAQFDGPVGLILNEAYTKNLHPGKLVRLDLDISSEK